MRAAAVALVLIPLAAAAREPALKARVDAIAKDALAHGAAGVQIAVLRHGKPVVNAAYGSANLELQVPLRPDAPMRIASITKQFTAAAVLRLAEQGKLTLDTPLSALLPDFPLQGRTVLVRHLLGHTSGIPSYTSLPEFAQQRALPLTSDQVVALFAGKPFDFEPGASWRYSNSGYHLLGKILEKLTGTPWADAVRTLVIEPAALKHTAYCDDVELLPGRVAGYAREGERFVNAAPLRMSIPYAAGSLCSTALETARFIEALAAGKVVSKESFAQMTTSVKPADGKDPQYGFGLAVAPFEGHRRVGHGGGINGFSSQQGHYPDDALTVVALVNSESGADLVEQRVARAALGLPERVVKDLPVSAAEQQQLAGVFQFGAAKYELKFVQGRAFGGAPGTPGERLLYQGHGIFADASSTDLLRVNVEGGRAVSMSLGDGMRWPLTAPRIEP